MSKKKSSHTTHLADLNSITIENKIINLIKYLSLDEKQRLLDYLINYVEENKYD